MNPVEHENGMPQERITLSTAEKTDGFATIMKRLKGRSAQERAALKAQADEAVLGYEAFALGHEYLEAGVHEAAGRWLRVAAGHGIPGAEQALGEMVVRQTLEDFADFTAVGGTALTVDAAAPEVVPARSGVCMTGGSHPAKGDELWVTVLDGVHAARQESAARAEAAQITGQARREADELLAEAQRQAQAILDDARAEAERLRKAVRRQVIEEAKTAARATSAALSLGKAAECAAGARRDYASGAAPDLPDADSRSFWITEHLPVRFSRGVLEAAQQPWSMPDVELTHWLTVALGPLQESELSLQQTDHWVLFAACSFHEQDGEKIGVDRTALRPYVTHPPLDEDQVAQAEHLWRARRAAVGSGPQRLAIGAWREGHEGAAADSDMDAEETV
ncbi:hypothetical protein ACFVYG_32575 [Streptomyces sp. NPDC058256]|uniref:hypothetical protein n=1 Tax=Streptomyces sp. NPDC058256 TaxID=3346408 RepID=UPI0036EAE852